MRAPYPILLVLLASASASAQSSLRYPLELAAGYDSNVANVRQGGKERESALVLMRGGVQQRTAFSALTGLELRADLEGQDITQHSGLSLLQARTGARLITRPSQSFYAPLFALGTHAAWSEFDSRDRDAGEIQATFFIQQPLTTRLSSRLSFHGLRRRAEETVFDASQHGVSLDVDWILAPALAAYAGYQHRRGDFITTTATVPPAAAATALAIAADDVFVGEFAVRQSGRAHIVTMGLNWALSSTYSLDLLTRHVDAESVIGTNYRREQILFSLLARL